MSKVDQFESVFRSADKQIYTHREIRFIGHVCTLNEISNTAPCGRSGPIRWMKLDSLNRLGLSTAMKYVVRALRAVAETE